MFQFFLYLKHKLWISESFDQRNVGLRILSCSQRATLHFSVNLCEDQYVYGLSLLQGQELQKQDKVTYLPPIASSFIYFLTKFIIQNIQVYEFKSLLCNSYKYRIFHLEIFRKIQLCENKSDYSFIGFCKKLMKILRDVEIFQSFKGVGEKVKKEMI